MRKPLKTLGLRALVDNVDIVDENKMTDDFLYRNKRNYADVFWLLDNLKGYFLKEKNIHMKEKNIHNFRRG